MVPPLLFDSSERGVTASFVVVADVDVDLDVVGVLFGSTTSAVVVVAAVVVVDCVVVLVLAFVVGTAVC